MICFALLVISVACFAGIYNRWTVDHILVLLGVNSHYEVISVK